MSAFLNPYLNFRGQAREALDFYAGVFGGELTVTTFGEFGWQGAEPEQVMHGQLNAPNGFQLMAADVPEGMELSSGSSLTICLSGDDVEQLHAWWEALIDGAEVGTPLEKQMWGDEYGACTDRFGVPWMINITLPKE